MKLKETLQDLSEVNEALHQYYVQSGDVWILDIDNSTTQAKIGEFRTNNIQLNNQVKQLTDQLDKSSSVYDQVKELQEKFKGIDPEVARAAIQAIQDNKDKELIDKGDIDGLVEQRAAAKVAEVQGTFEQQINDLQTQLNESVTQTGTYKARLSDVVVDNSLQKAVSNVATVRKGAMQDVLSRGRSVFFLDDSGKPVPKDAEGNVILGKDGVNPIGMEEWASNLVLDASYLFEGNAGGGAGGGGGGGGGSNSGGQAVKGTVDGGDQDAINANIADIAAGTVQVV